MAKKTSKYICSSCGSVSEVWMGRCPDCSEWSTFVEEVQDKKTKVKKSSHSAVKISEVEYENYNRTSSGFDELDVVLGGGIVDGSLILVGGDPGIGKSTLLLQVANNISKSKKVLYVSGEESLSQIKLRAARVGAKKSDILLLSENEISSIITNVDENKPDVLIVDSIQTVYDEDISSAQGSVSQVREITNKLMHIAKGRNIVVFIIGHVTKSGTIAGPKVLEHIVDTVLYFEGEKNNVFRLIRAVKNRFGSTNELGVFQMNSEGLKGVENPSELFIGNRPKNEAGSVVCPTMEGTRPLLIEVQALCSITSYPSPRRVALGMDYNRLSILLAVMDKKLGITMNTFDVYLNVVGGVSVTETAVDLAVISAVVSSYRNRSVDEETIVFGEVGLAGEIRAVSDAEKRVKEATKLGFKRIILPKANAKNIKTSAKLYPVERLEEVLNLLF